jgi:hypothetical protein
MAADDAISATLAQLTSIAQAPMTAPERLQRAKPVVGKDLALGDIVGAASRGDTPWCGERAAAHGIDVETWLQAVHVADVPNSDSLDALIDRLHRAEAAADMLKAGYKPERGAQGRLTWSGRG